MDDSLASKVVLSIMSMFALVIAFGGFIWSFTWASKGLGKLGKSLQSGIQRAANRGANLGKKAAMNSKYGQAAQQFMGNRKSISQLKGREALRGALEKNPNLMKLMGGVGGQKYAARYLDAEQRKHDSEQVQNLKQGLTGNVASYGVAGGQTREAMQRGYWLEADGKTRRDVTAADRTAVSKLQQEGYMDQNHTVRGDSHLARASLGSIMDVEIATPENVGTLARMVGQDTKQNALFTEMLQSEAGKHGYKNLQYADVTGGELNPQKQYYVKDPNDAENGARKVVQSGLSGVNKDALDPTMDTSLLKAVEEEYKAASDQGRGDAFIRKIAEQTKHIDKDKVVEAISQRLSIDINDFQDLRASIKSGGAIPPPTRFAGSGGQQAPAPAQQQPTIVVPGQPAPTPPGQIIVDHNPPPSNGPRDRPGGNFNGFS